MSQGGDFSFMDNMSLKDMPDEVGMHIFETAFNNTQEDIEDIGEVLSRHVQMMDDKASEWFVVPDEGEPYIDYEAMATDFINLGLFLRHHFENPDEEAESGVVDGNKVLLGLAYLSACIELGNDQIEGVREYGDQLNKAIEIYNQTPLKIRRNPMVYMEELAELHAQIDRFEASGIL